MTASAAAAAAAATLPGGDLFHNPVMKGMTNYFQGTGAGCLNNRRGGEEGWAGRGGVRAPSPITSTPNDAIAKRHNRR